jgi:hypothetical protein
VLVDANPDAVEVMRGRLDPSTVFLDATSPGSPGAPG